MALTVVSSIVAVALDGFSPLKAPASSGSPSSASIALNSTFSDFQPMVLNASVTPTAVFPEPPPPLLPPPLPLTRSMPSPRWWSWPSAWQCSRQRR